MLKFRLCFLLFLSTVAPLYGEEQPDIKALDQRVRILERLLELEKEANKEKAKQTPAVGAGKDGFFLKSADGAYQLKLRGYVQADGRLYFADESQKFTNTFLLRRVRPILEGTLAKIADFRIMPDFGGGQTVLQDAYLDIKISGAVKVRAGKFKAPVGIERLQSGTDIAFVERALPTSLAPNRDLGVQLHGDLGKGVFNYALGVFNGVLDGGSADTDTTDSKEIAARLFATPFKNAESKTLQGLGLGIAISSGNHTGTIASSGLAGYRSVGQQSFFAYRSDATEAGTTIADGQRLRFSPQGHFYAGPFGILAEYISSSQDVKKGDAAETLTNTAWQATATYILTGEKAGFKNPAPAKNFEPEKGAWGSFELVARYGQLQIDKDAFPVFADPKKAAAKATEWGVGANWALNRHIKIFLDYHQTAYEGGASDADRDTEKVLFQRFQVNF